ncbi:hypothetical protein [Nocardioides daejeonensis]|uniref:hypothetical protein n=1 Tax=Nocardioides daejeonensis TaxID=1046556 RepID=UPI0013A5859A|nr:hypothetical protein [Nocardioides daejeonensis]
MSQQPGYDPHYGSHYGPPVEHPEGTTVLVLGILGTALLIAMVVFYVAIFSLVGFSELA